MIKDKQNRKKINPLRGKKNLKQNYKNLDIIKQYEKIPNLIFQ